MKPTQQQSLQHAALVCLPLLASTTTWQVQIAMGICIRNGTGLHDLQGQIQLDPTRDYISVVILNVLLSVYCFPRKCSIFGAHSIQKVPLWCRNFLFGLSPK